MRILIVFILCISFSGIFGQVTVSGKVSDKVTGKALEGVSIYISNTSIGTSSNANGGFVIKNINLQKFDLIASSVGYETFNTTITADKDQSLTIELNPKPKELDALIIRAYEKDGWNKWGKLFTDYFVGTSPIAKDCSIKNTNALKFRLNKKENTLYVDAAEPLQIKNDGLGYQLTYDLQAFTYNFTTHMLYYAGYPLFTEMTGSNKKIKRWNKKRKEAYNGSMMHFMRSIYRNKLQEEGFTIYRLKRVENTEKERVKLKYKSLLKLLGRDQIDSAEYYDRILRQPDFSDYAEKTPIIADSIAFALDSTTAGLRFPNYIQVIYANKVEYPEYATYQGRGFPAENISALITLVNHNFVAVYQNGMYYDSKDLIFEGFWSWSEKIGEMLPFDYVYKPD